MGSWQFPSSMQPNPQTQVCPSTCLDVWRRACPFPSRSVTSEANPHQHPLADPLGWSLRTGLEHRILVFMARAHCFLGRHQVFMAVCQTTSAMCRPNPEPDYRSNHLPLLVSVCSLLPTQSPYSPGSALLDPMPP